MSSRAIREYFGDDPGDPNRTPLPPEKERRSVGPRLSFFAAVPRSSYEKAPGAERFTWNVIGGAFLLVCIFSSAAATLTWSLQIGESVRHVLYVPLIWIPVIATIELVISVSIRPEMGKLAALLLALRLMIGFLIGFQVSEPIVAYLNHKAIAVQVAKDIHEDSNKQIAGITRAGNKTISKLRNQREAIIRKEGRQAKAVSFWTYHVPPCHAGATPCTQGHAAALERAKQTRDAQIKVDAPRLASLDTRINGALNNLDADTKRARKTAENSNDLTLRERALGELMHQHGFIFIFVWSLRFIFWGVDLAAVLLKMWFVRRGTVVDKANEAEAARAEVEQKRNHAIATAEQLELAILSDHFRAVAEAAAKVRGEQFVAALTGRSSLHVVSHAGGGAEMPEPQIAVKPKPNATEEGLQRALETERALRLQAEEDAHSAVEMAKRIGSLEGRYEIERRIGHGGSSEVWLARDLKRRRMPVAIKVLRGDRKIGQTELGWISDERKMLVKLRHPHIVRMLGSHIFKDGRPAIVLEYVPGKSLDKAFSDRVASGGRFSVEEMLTVILPVCEALHYLHGTGRIHQDIKPANVLGCGSGDAGDIRLTDFHITALIGRVPKRLAGTDGYQAPEQMRHAALDERSDLYAVGIIMFELVSGARLFGRTSDTEFTREQPPAQADILTYTHSIPLSKVIAACLSPDPDYRPQTALQLYDELRKAVGQARTPINDGPERPKDGSTLPYDEIGPRRADPGATARYEDEDDAEGERFSP